MSPDPPPGFGADPGGGQPPAPLPPDEVGEDSITTEVPWSVEDSEASAAMITMHGAKSLLQVEAGEDPIVTGKRRFSAPSLHPDAIDAYYGQYTTAREQLVALRNDPERWGRVGPEMRSRVEVALGEALPSADYFAYRAAVLELTATTGIAPDTGRVDPEAFGNSHFGDANRAQAALGRANQAIDRLRATGPDPALSPQQQGLVEQALSRPLPPDFWWAEQAGWISGKQAEPAAPAAELAHAESEFAKAEQEFRGSVTEVDVAPPGHADPAAAPRAEPSAPPGDPMADYGIPSVDEMLGDVRELQISGLEFPDEAGGERAAAPDAFDPGGVTHEMPGVRPAEDSFAQHPPPAPAVEPGEPAVQPQEDPFKHVDAWTGEETSGDPFRHVDAWTGAEGVATRGDGFDPGGVTQEMPSREAAAEYGIGSVPEAPHQAPVTELQPGEIEFPPETAATHEPAPAASDPMADYGIGEPPRGGVAVEPPPAGVDLEGSVREEAAPSFDRANSFDAINYENARQTLAREMGTVPGDDLQASIARRSGDPAVADAAYAQMEASRQSLVDRLGETGGLDMVDPVDRPLVDSIRSTELPPKELVDLKVANLDLLAGTGVDPHTGKAHPELRDGAAFGDEASIRDAAARQSAALDALKAQNGAGLTGPDRTYWVDHLSQQPMNGDAWVAVSKSPPADLVPFTPGQDAYAADRAKNMMDLYARDTLAQLDSASRAVAGEPIIDVSVNADGYLQRNDYASLADAPPEFRDTMAREYGEAIGSLEQMSDAFWSSLDPAVADRLRAHMEAPVFEPPPPAQAVVEAPPAGRGGAAQAELPPADGETPPTRGNEAVASGEETGPTRGNEPVPGAAPPADAPAASGQVTTILEDGLAGVVGGDPSGTGSAPAAGGEAPATTGGQAATPAGEPPATGQPPAAAQPPAASGDAPSATGSPPPAAAEPAGSSGQAPTGSGEPPASGQAPSATAEPPAATGSAPPVEPPAAAGSAPTAPGDAPAAAASAPPPPAGDRPIGTAQPATPGEPASVSPEPTGVHQPSPTAPDAPAPASYGTARDTAAAPPPVSLTEPHPTSAAPAPPSAGIPAPAHPAPATAAPAGPQGGPPIPPDVQVPEPPPAPPPEAPAPPPLDRQPMPAPQPPDAQPPPDQGGTPVEGDTPQGHDTPAPRGKEPGAVEPGPRPAGGTEPPRPGPGGTDTPRPIGGDGTRPIGGRTGGGETPAPPPEGEHTTPEPEGGEQKPAQPDSSGRTEEPHGGGEETPAPPPPEEPPPVTKESLLADARTAFEQAGYKDVSITAQDDGTYRIQATDPKGNAVDVKVGSPDEPWIKNPPSEWPHGAAGVFQSAMTGLMVWDAVDNVLANADPETAFALMDAYADACKAIADANRTGDSTQAVAELSNLMKKLTDLAGPLAGNDAATAAWNVAIQKFVQAFAADYVTNGNPKVVRAYLQQYMKIKRWVMVERGKYRRLKGILESEEGERLIGEDLTGFELFPGFTHARNVYRWLKSKVKPGSKKTATGSGTKGGATAQGDGTRPVRRRPVPQPEETPEQKRKKQADQLVARAADDVKVINWCDEQIRDEQKQIDQLGTRYATGTGSYDDYAKAVDDHQAVIDRLNDRRYQAEADLKRAQAEAQATGVQLGPTATNYPDSQAARDYQTLVDLDVEIEKQRDKVATLLPKARAAQPPYEEQPEYKEYVREGWTLIEMEQRRKKIATGLEGKGVKVPPTKYPDKPPGYVPEPGDRTQEPKKAPTPTGGGAGTGPGSGPDSPPPPPPPPDPPPPPQKGTGSTGVKQAATTAVAVCAIGFGLGSFLGPSGGGTTTSGGGQPTAAVTANQVAAQPVLVTPDPNAPRPPAIVSLTSNPIGDGGTNFYQVRAEGAITSYSWGFAVDPKCGTLQVSHDPAVIWDHHPCDSTQESEAVVLSCVQGPGGVAEATVPALAATGSSGPTTGGSSLSSPPQTGGGSCDSLVANHQTKPPPLTTTPGTAPGPPLAGVPTGVALADSAVATTTTGGANGGLVAGGALLLAGSGVVAVRRRKKLPPYPCGPEEVALGKAWDELQKMGNQLSDAHRALDRADKELMDALHYDDALRAYVYALQSYCDMLQQYVDQLQQSVDQLQTNLDNAFNELDMHGVPAAKLSHRQRPGWVKVATGLWAADQKTAGMAGAAVDPSQATMDVLNATLELDNAEADLEIADSDLTDCTFKLDFAEGDLKDADAQVQTRVRAYAQAKEDYAAAQERYKQAKAAYDAALEALGACRTKWAADVKAAEAAP